MWQWWCPMMGHFKAYHQLHCPLTMAGVSATKGWTCPCAGCSVD